MKTKNIIAFGLLSGTMILTGCSESFLEVDSYTEPSGESYYVDSVSMEQNLIAAYSPLEWNDWNGSQYNPQNIMSDIMADDIWPGGASAMDNQYWHLMMNYEPQPVNCMTGIWNNMYSGVKRTNDVIANAERNLEAGTISERQYKSLTAQARVLRAYYYNLLWKFYGNIPYFVENLSSADGYKAPQLKADEIYKNVIEDLEAVIQENALPMKWDIDNQGRVSQAMAYMLYTEMVMYQNDEARFQTALGYMKALINSGVYGLAPDYNAIFTEDGEWSEESIFEVIYTDYKSFRGWGSGDAVIAGGTVLPRVITCPGAIGELGLDEGWGFAPVREDVYSMYKSRDKRRTSSAFDLRAYSYKPRYQDTGFWLGKYVAYTANVEDADGDKQLNYNNNLRIYRFSEVLLNAAELIVRTTGNEYDTEAMGYLNAVRNRAGLTQTADNLSPTIDNIIEERHLEFVGEGKRYWDLVRAEGISGFSVSQKASKVLTPKGYRTNTWTVKSKYQPIPYTEISADPSLEQNPGY